MKKDPENRLVMKNSIWNWKLRSNVFIYIQKLTSTLPKIQKTVVEDHNLYWLLKKFFLISNSGYNNLLSYISFSQTLPKNPNVSWNVYRDSGGGGGKGSRSGSGWNEETKKKWSSNTFVLKFLIYKSTTYIWYGSYWISCP